MTAPAFAPLPLRDDTDLREPVTVFDQLATDPRWGIGPDGPHLRLVADMGRRMPPASAETLRKRRFLLLLAATLVVLAVARLSGLSMLSFAPAASAQIDQSAPAVVVVQPGDSYGAVATMLGADNPAQFGERLRLANGGADLEVGQRLVVDMKSLGG